MNGTKFSLRLDSKLYNHMMLHDEIDWDAVIHNSISRQLDELEQIDVARAQRAAESADRIRKSGIFAGGKTSEEIIREWRDKRR